MTRTDPDIPFSHGLSRRHARKKALCIGVPYLGLDEAWQLPMAVRDPLALRDLLVDSFDFNEDDVKILVDDGCHILPTRENIVEHIGRLVYDLQAGDHLVFHCLFHVFSFLSSGKNDMSKFLDTVHKFLTKMVMKKKMDWMKLFGHPMSK